MNRSTQIGQRLAGVFLLGCVLLNYPVLYLFNRSEEFLGIPILIAYVFAAWLVLIGLMAYVIEKRGDSR